jgi:hypothetical protein
MKSDEVNGYRQGLVSVWVGTFPSLEAAEAYFGIPDEIDVYLPPEGFGRDLGIPDFAPECLEVNFEQVTPRSLRQLLQTATFSASFMDQALDEANRQGIQEAQGIALLYDFDYQTVPGWQRTAGPMRFVGSFPFVGSSREEEPESRPDPRFDIRGPMDTVL